MGRKKRFKKKIQNWWNGYLDFSKLTIEGYSYLKSTYKKDIASALITTENIALIEKLIPIYKKNENFRYKTIRILFDRRTKEKDFQESYLYRIYCNGFVAGFKDINKILNRLTKNSGVPTLDSCLSEIKIYCTKLDNIEDCPTKDSKGFDFVDFLVDIGMREGAKVRGILYDKELNGNPVNVPKLKKTKKTVGRKKVECTLSEMFALRVSNEEELVYKIEKYLKSKSSALDIAYLKIALEELEYLNEQYDVTAFYKAIEREYDTIELIDVRGVQKSIKWLNDYIEGKNIFMKDYETERKQINELKEFLSK